MVQSNQSLPPIPEAWLRSADALVGTVSLSVAGFDVTVELDRATIERVYLPLLMMLHQRARSQRVLAGLAGIPGAGKTTFAAALYHVARGILASGALVVVSLDGWHWPNEVLDARTILDEEGHPMPLRVRKGGPDSYDVASLTHAMDRLRGETGNVALPLYDRRLHEPVPNGVFVVPDSRIIVLEGNYLLSPEPPWDAVSARLAPKLFLDCDPDEARARVLARHVRGGCTRGQAERKWEANDRLNTQTVLRTAPSADCRIRLGPEPTVIPRA